MNLDAQAVNDWNATYLVDQGGVDRAQRLLATRFNLMGAGIHTVNTPVAATASLLHLALSRIAASRCIESLSRIAASRCM